jgi:hypothetical protein
LPIGITPFRRKKAMNDICSELAREQKLQFALGGGIKLIIRRNNKLTVTFNCSGSRVDKYVETVFGSNNASPMLPITIVMDANNSLPADAPISELYRVLTRLADSFARLGSDDDGND